MWSWQHLILEHCITHSKSHKETPHYLVVTPHPPTHLEPQATTNLLCVPRDLIIVYISYKWNYTHVIAHVCFLLVSIVLLRAISVEACINTSFLARSGTFPVVGIWHFTFISPSTDGHLGSFHLLALMNYKYSCVSSSVNVCFHFSWIYESYGFSPFNILTASLFSKSAFTPTHSTLLSEWPG